MSISQKDITLLTNITELPDTFGKEGDFLRVKTDGSGDPEWFDTNTGSVSIGTGLFGNGSVSQPSITFQSDTNTGLYLVGEDDIGITTGGIQRLDINGTSVDVGTAINNLNLNVNGTSSSTNFKAGNGASGTPSYSFTNDSDTGMYFESSGGAERLRFSVNGTDRILASSSGVTQITGRINTDAGTVSAPSIYLTDTATGLYRPAANELAVSCNSALCANFTSSGITVGGTATNARRNVTVNGSVILGLGAAVLSNATYNWDTSFGTNACSCWDINTSTGNVIIQLNSSGTTATNQLFGRTVRFARYNGNTSGTVTFQATGGTVRLNMASGSEAVTTGNTFTIFSIPAGIGCIFEIMRIDSNQYFLNVLAYWNQTTSISTAFNHTTNASLGAVGTPSYSFVGDTDTGIFSPTANQLAITTNGIQNTNFTTTGVDIGLNNVNNTNLKTLTQNGASNFNSFTPSYSSFLLPQTAIGTITQALSGCDFDGTNYVVSVAGISTGARLFVSSNLSTWTTISDTQIALGNSQVQYGNGIWCYLSRTNNLQQLWTSTSPATTWTQIGAVVPWTTARQANRLKFINGQFIVLMTNSIIRFSSNGTTWTEYTANATLYSFNDITYSPELQRYVIVTATNAVLYFSGNTITNTSAFTVVTTNAENANCCSYSPKYSLFLYHGNTNSQRYYISKDGINWTFYTNPTTVTNSNNTIWISDFGGFFLDMQFNQSQVAVSRDGLSFQVITSNLTMTTINAVYNSIGKVLLIVGSSGSWGTFRNLLTDFNAYVDSDNIYNTFNSNIRFADTIQYQQQNIITASGNNHYTPFSFNRSVINFDTASANANIYLLGSSYPNTAGVRFKIIKNLSSSNSVRIHGYETTLFISERYGVINNFNSQSSPQVYTMLDAGYFGSFDLVRYSDVGNGSWGIENLEIYTNTGVKINNSTLFLDKLDIATSNQCNFDAPVNISGTFKATKESIGEGTYTSGLNVETSTLLTWSKYNYINTSSTNFYINLLNLNASGLDNFTIYFCGTFDNTATNYYITNSMGAGQIVIVYKNGSTTTLTNTQDTTIDTTQWVRCTYKHQYRSSTNYWLVHQYSS